MVTFPSPQSFMGELHVWQNLFHPHLLPFLGVLFDEHVSLVSPFVDNGSLPMYLMDHPDADRPRFVSHYSSIRDSSLTWRCRKVRELAEALTYLHKMGVVHGDVKGGNVLVSSEVKILLCDFGLAKMMDTNTSTSKAGLGTLRWQAPELMDGGSKTFQSDVYAFGLTIYEVSVSRTSVPHILSDRHLDPKRESPVRGMHVRWTHCQCRYDRRRTSSERASLRAQWSAV